MKIMEEREKLPKVDPEKVFKYPEGTVGIRTPTSVGGYRFGSSPNYYTQFNFTYKPTWFHRTMMRIFFDMHWFDN
jgi:hypothetical protein